MAFIQQKMTLPAAAPQTRPALAIIHRTATIAPEPAMFAFIVVFLLPYCPRCWWPLFRLIRDELTLDHELRFGAISCYYTVSAFGRRRLILRYLGRQFFDFGILQIHRMEPAQQFIAMMLFAYDCRWQEARLEYVVKPLYRVYSLRPAVEPVQRWQQGRNINRSQRARTWA